MHPLLQLDSHRNQLIQVLSLSSKCIPFPVQVYSPVSLLIINMLLLLQWSWPQLLLLLFFFHIILAKAVTSTYMFMNFNRTYSFLCGS